MLYSCRTVEGEKMIKQLSNNITSFLLHQDIIQKNKQEIYTYGFEYLISLFISVVGIIIIAFSMGWVLETVGFIIGFFLVRSVSGGYHAKTHLQCQIMSYIVYALNMLILKVLFEHIKSTVLLTGILAIVSILLIFIFAPIDHHNKPFSENEYSFYKAKSRKLVITLLIIALLGEWGVKEYRLFFLAIIFGVTTAAMAVINIKMFKKESNYGKI